MWRDEIDGIGQGHHGDKTTTGTTCFSSLQGSFWNGSPAPLLKGDRTGVCPACGKTGSIGEGALRRRFGMVPVALDGAVINCGCPRGTNRLIARAGTWLGPGEPPHAYEPMHVVLARMNCETTAEPEQYSHAAKKKKREITLTLGVFFDGTGNNAVNTDNMLKAYTARHYNLADAEVEGILAKCAREDMGVSGLGATSYTSYYTNVHWLNTLYKKTVSGSDSDIQKEIYIDGIGTEVGKSDSMAGMVFGSSDTGVIAKTDKAVNQLAQAIKTVIGDIKSKLPTYEIVIKALQFDIFGFSRGAAASRHFANRLQSEDTTIISAIREGISGTTFEGAPAGKIRFIGIFDTVAAIGTPTNGLNPHNADSGNVTLTLRPGVAEKVFHITAAHECRFNFALNSVKPAWPELALPGAHSDIGGGYLPEMKENLFLTRPETDSVPLNLPGTQTRAYHQTVKQMTELDAFPAIAPILRTNEITAETWYDDRMPRNQYGEPQKRSYAAMTLRNRIVKNDWSKVVLRVMLDAALEAGVLFDEIQENDNFNISDELRSLTEKTLAMGKAARTGQSPGTFTQSELDIIAGKYIHCSANWNAIVVDTDGMIQGGASPSEIVGFVNRPDENWQRTIYNMDGKKR